MIGFIGLGRMGRPMAQNLSRKGFDLIVHDTNPDALGGFSAVAPGELAAASDIPSEHWRAVARAKRIALPTCCWLFTGRISASSGR